MPEKTTSEILDILAKRYRMGGFHKIHRKKVFFEGILGERSVIVCTPKSKLHVNGHGWTDITLVQVQLMKEYDIAIYAFRVEDGNTHFVCFNEMNKYMTNSTRIFNEHEKEHWKLYIWPDEIEVRGNNRRLSVKPNDFSLIECAAKT